MKKVDKLEIFCKELLAMDWIRLVGAGYITFCTGFTTGLIMGLLMKGVAVIL